MSLYISVYDSLGGFVRNADMDPTLFAEDFVVSSLVHEFVVMYLANKRQSTAHTKNRSEVQASGRKLYRQKGTGSARVGAASSPIRRKWWVVFGPRKERNYTKTMTKKMKSRALQSSLILKAKSEQLFSVDSYEATWKTKDFAKLVDALPVNSSLLVVLPVSNDFMYRSMRNVARVNVTFSDLVNPYDLVSHTNVLFVNDAFEKIVTRLS